MSYHYKTFGSVSFTSITSRFLEALFLLLILETSTWIILYVLNILLTAMEETAINKISVNDLQILRNSYLSLPYISAALLKQKHGEVK